jgi:hypothetical protein
MLKDGLRAVFFLRRKLRRLLLGCAKEVPGNAPEIAILPAVLDEG